MVFDPSKPADRESLPPEQAKRKPRRRAQERILAICFWMLPISIWERFQLLRSEVGKRLTLFDLGHHRKTDGTQLLQWLGRCSRAGKTLFEWVVFFQISMEAWAPWNSGALGTGPWLLGLWLGLKFGILAALAHSFASFINNSLSVPTSFVHKHYIYI